MKPHKWQKEIIAWANGETIQYRHGNGWNDIIGYEPVWSSVIDVFRVKPEPVYLYSGIGVPQENRVGELFMCISQARSHKDGGADIRFTVLDGKVTAVELLK